MTYNEIAEWIATLTPEQKESEATVFLNETIEYIPVNCVRIGEASGILDSEQPIIEIVF